MKNQNIDHSLEDARLPDIQLDKNHQAVRKTLEVAILANSRQAHKKRVSRTIFSMGVTVGFALGIGLVWMLQREPPPIVVATNLGTIWCTYSDNSHGGNSVVWPPESTLNQNNFVKSAPGYGEKGYAVRFTGKTGEQSHEGFIGVSTILGPPCPDAGCSGVNIQKYKKVRFKMKGQVSGGELVLLISNLESNKQQIQTTEPSAVQNGLYEAKITGFVSNEWQTVTLDLRTDFDFPERPQGKVLTAEDVLADAKNLKWHVRNGKGADVDVWIDELEFY